MSLNDEEEHFNLVSLLLTKPKVLKLQSVLFFPVGLGVTKSPGVNAIGGVSPCTPLTMAPQISNNNLTSSLVI